MKILGIETSCDETAAAIVENGTKILSSVVASSAKLHQKTGGIIPEVAAREQLKCIIPVIKETVSNCKLKIENLDAIAVTVGPGLIGSLLVGIETAKTLAYIFNKKIVPINHLRAHLYANWLIPEQKGKRGKRQKLPQFPAVGLVVSGGHTDLVLVKGHTAPAYARHKTCMQNKIKWLGGTRDDAAGECFDKTARVLGLPYPGGPAIAKLAEKGKSTSYPLPRPMLKQKNFDFSFSGLKTSVINLVREEKKINKANLAASIQEAIIDSLVEKTIQAAKKYKVKSILLAGGVAANSRLGEKFKSRLQTITSQLYIPPPGLCTDNAAYVASCAFFNYKPSSWKNLKANPNLSIANL